MLSQSILDELTASLEASAGEPGIASATVAVDDLDPAALAFGSRQASDRWYAWEQPDRGFALAGVGSAAEVVSRGPDRFGDVASDCARLNREISSRQPDGLPAGAGPVWCGGFAFDAAGGASPQWSSLPPALLWMPELAACRTDSGSYLTATLRIRTSADRDRGLARVRGRLAAMDPSPLPLLDPAPDGAMRVRGAQAPSAYEAAVASAVAAIEAGRLRKVVIAREVLAEGPRAHDSAAIFGAMRELFPSCFCFCVGTPEAAFLGASPELLVRRRGAGAQTVALAGSTRRSADPAVDDHLGEQLRRSAKNRSEHEIVVKRIERALRRHSVWVENGGEPELVKVANIQHLGTPIHAQLADPRSAVELAGILHPTPAVGGEPDERATRLIAELEGLDRGWYAGPVGWMDSVEDGEFCVALRSALLRDRTAHLFAGAGIVADSDPEAELAETELKLGALLPLVAG